MRIRNECTPSILNKDTLMSEDFDFMTKSKIEEECVCTKKNTCKAVIDLLLHGKINEAYDLLTIEKHK